MEKLVKRFLDYVKFDTQSEMDSKSYPSTDKQLVLGKALAEEMKALGLSDVEMDSYGYVTATLPSNTDKKLPVIGFLAHMDTAPDFTGENIKTQIVSNYDGGDILLNKEAAIVLSPTIFPELKKYIGQDLITTDGTTLLGADNKAGIAEIMTAIEYLIMHPEIKHGTIRIAFTPDEEIGSGVDHFNVDKFNADFAYTIDGGEIGELEYESFNAAQAKIRINGCNTHPGQAKNKMKNSLEIAMELNSMLPSNEKPMYTEGCEGYYHLNDMNGNVEKAYMHYILRDHDRSKFESRKNRMEKIAGYLNDKYGENTIELTLKDQYYNMREKIEPVIHIVDTAKKAMEEVGVKPIIKAIRGGTDGSRLSYMGLPTPNIFTGGHNYHGKYEFIPIQSMHKAVDVILKIIELYSTK